MGQIKNHYAALGVSPGASSGQILQARNRLLKKFHPDVHQGDKTEAKERTIGILLAAEVLLDPLSRLEYDRIYFNVFEPASRAKAERKGSPPPPRPGADAPPAEVLCSRCGRRNVRARRDYCIYCGAGIGDNPQPFSWDDSPLQWIDRNRRPSLSFSQFLASDVKSLFTVLAPRLIVIYSVVFVLGVCIFLFRVALFKVARGEGFGEFSFNDFQVMLVVAAFVSALTTLGYLLINSIGNMRL